MNEETARHSKLIFSMQDSWLHFVLTSAENVDSSWNYEAIVTFL